MSKFNADAVMLRTTDALGRAYGNFQYPLDAEVGTIIDCPDWDPKPRCGGGFHGLLDGRGNWGLMRAPSDANAIWWIWGVMRSEAVDLDQEKVKVPRMQLIYKGSFGGAMAQVSTAMADSILRQIKDTTAAAKKTGEKTNSGYGGASTNSGDYGASTNSGDYGASTNSGTRGASTNSGYGGASTNSGDYGASTNSGYGGVAVSVGGSSKASSEGGQGLAVAAGYDVAAMIGPDDVMVLIERDDNLKIIGKLIASVGEHGIEAGKWYKLKGGKPVEVAA